MHAQDRSRKAKQVGRKDTHKWTINSAFHMYKLSIPSHRAHPPKHPEYHITSPHHAPTTSIPPKLSSALIPSLSNKLTISSHPLLNCSSPFSARNRTHSSTVRPFSGLVRTPPAAPASRWANVPGVGFGEVRNTLFISTASHGCVDVRCESCLDGESNSAPRLEGELRFGVPCARGMRVVFVGERIGAGAGCFADGWVMEEGWFSLSLPFGLGVTFSFFAER